MKLTNHEYANLFPMMPQADLERLAKDIAENGLMEPVITLDGKILDGRNRYAACEIADVPPLFLEYGGTDPLAFVVSHNLNRRHLDESQRGMIAGKIANMPHGGQAYSPPKSDGSIDPSVPKGKSNSEAAALMNVSTATVKRAKRVIANAIPSLQDMVETSEIPVSAAALVAALPAEQQRKIVSGGISGVKEAAKKLRTPKPSQTQQGGSLKNLDLDAQELDSSQAESRVAKSIPDDADRLWALAKTDLDKILRQDKSRVRVLNKIIEYCQSRLSENK